MRIIDRLMRRKQQSTPRVVKVEPGMLTIEARGCRIVINEYGTDQRGRELTSVNVKMNESQPGDPPYSLITNPTDPFKSRSLAVIHVVKLKALRKPKQAKPPEQEKASEGPTGGYRYVGGYGSIVAHPQGAS